MSKYLKVEVSSETKKQADDILNALLDKRLVTGGQLIAAPARFLWKGKVSDMDYLTITSFSLQRHKAAIIAAVKKISVEEVPMIVFMEIDANPELLKWIDTTVA